MEDVIGLIVITFCTIFAGIVMWKFFDVVRNSIKKNNPGFDEDKFDRLAKAFIEYRKETDRRLERIEGAFVKQEARQSLSNNHPFDDSISIRDLDHNSGNSSNKNRTN